MSKAQLEASYHWIFVLLAGGTFLVLFFFAIKSCVSTGEERADSADVRYATSSLGTLATQPAVRDKTLELPPLDVTCPQSTLTLSTPRTSGEEPVRDSLEGAPVFLPPAIGGANRIVTANITISALTSSAPPIGLGNVLYAINENTYYYIISDGAGAHLQPLGVLGNNPQLRVVPNVGALASEEVPKTASTVVIVSFSGVQNPAIDARGASVRQVVFDTAQRKVQFFERRNNAFVALGGAQSYADAHFAAGAIIVGAPQAYSCAKANTVARMRYVTKLAEQRRAALTAAAGLEAHCKPILQAAQADLALFNNEADNDRYLAELLRPNAPVLGRQRSLFEQGCPVIA